MIAEMVVIAVAVTSTNVFALVAGLLVGGVASAGSAAPGSSAPESLSVRGVVGEPGDGGGVGEGEDDGCLPEVGAVDGVHVECGE
jgi:hypothetical protein